MFGLAAAPVAAVQADIGYSVNPVRLADGIWMVRGVDAPIERANGGAIANLTIIDTPAGTIICDCGPSVRFAKALKARAEALTGKPLIRVYITHLHPDHGLGMAAFDPAIVAALPQTIIDMKRDGPGFSDAFYRLLGDAMRGTELAVPGIPIERASEDFGGRTLRLLSLSGHSAGDLAIVDERTGILIGGDLVFHDRAPSTPTANLADWRKSLDRLDATPHAGAIPGHGAYDADGKSAIAQTRDWIDWLETALRRAMQAGLGMVEAGNIPIPERFGSLAAARYELQRSVVHLYPALEAEMLPRVDLPSAR